MDWAVQNAGVAKTLALLTVVVLWMGHLPQTHLEQCIMV